MLLVFFIANKPQPTKFIGLPLLVVSNPINNIGNAKLAGLPMNTVSHPANLAGLPTHFVGSPTFFVGPPIGSGRRAYRLV